MDLAGRGCGCLPWVARVHAALVDESKMRPKVLGGRLLYYVPKQEDNSWHG